MSSRVLRVIQVQKPDILPEEESIVASATSSVDETAARVVRQCGGKHALKNSRTGPDAIRRFVRQDHSILRKPAVIRCALRMLHTA